MKLAAYTVSIITTFGFVTKAAADPPAWCSAVGNNRIDTSGGIKDAVEDENARNALKNLVGRLCKPDAEDKEHMKELEAARQRWSTRLDLTEADWVDVADYATLGQGERMNGEVRINTNGQEIGIGESLKRAWSEFDALDQYAMIGRDAGASGDLALDHNYLVDAFGAKLTETGRFAYVRGCVKSSRNGPVQWAMCQGDIAQLDLQKLAGELRANKVYRGADKVRVRIEVDELKPVLVLHAAKIKKLIAGDPGYAKMFQAAEATRNEWLGREKTDAELIGLAAAMDDARATNSRKAFAGCEDKTWAAWKGAMATIPAKKFEGMHDDRANGVSFVDTAMGPIISNPSVYLASAALTTCMTVGQDRGAKHDVLIRLLGDAMERWPGFRGPRTATQSAIMTTGITLDDRDAKLEYPEVHRAFGGGGGSRSGGGDGVIGQLKPSGKTVTVEFKKQMVKQVQCAQVKYSNRVTQIRSDGTLIYESTCVKNETVIVDKSDAPQTVNARYLEGVKPGMFVSIIEDVVTAARAKPGSATPTMVFGVALK
jgi:hypothetical protein